MTIENEKNRITEFAAKIKACGFRVFIAEKGTYGFVTDDEGARVMCFGCNFGGIRLSGNYEPSNGCGTGWQMMEFAPDNFNAEIVSQWLYASAPSWANKAPVYTTLKSHLKRFQDSSRYKELIDMEKVLQPA